VASLVGTHLPDVELPAHNGEQVNLSAIVGTSVVFCYPFTGRPNHPNPEGWDTVPGAHGSTPQALAFSTLYHEFVTLHVKVFGLSLLSSDWQKDFATRNHLPYQLLSDSNQTVTRRLSLETFRAGPDEYLARRTIIISNGVIQHDIYPVFHPEQNAADVLALLRS
jgi:peroxiredoxin